MTAAKTPIARLKRGHIYIQSQVLIEDLELDVFAGEVLGIWGTNGCGKTTLLKVIAGIRDAGQENADACERVVDSGVRIGYLPQHPMAALLPWYRCHENLQLHASGALSREESVNRLVTELGFSDGRWNLHPHRLSGGYQQRLAWACATLPCVRIIALDEAFGHQDATWIPKLLGEIRRKAAEGCAIVMVTHDPELLVLASERIAVLRRSGGVTRLTGLVDVHLQNRDLAGLQEDELKDKVAALGRHLYCD